MSQQAEYLLKVFEKIGTPLMVAILDGARGQPESDNLEEHAQKMSELLGKTVQASIDLGQTIEISKLGESSDAVRLSLAALLSPMIGQSFKNNRRIPDENDLKKITQALQSVLSFSSNFSPTDQHNVRLDLLEAAAQNVDGPQTTIQQIQAFTPVLQAVSSFAFGQPEQKLMIDITTKLTNKAVEIRAASFGSLNEEEQKRIDLALLKSLALLYKSCHEQEVARISTMSDDEQAAGLSLDPLWNEFDKKAILLQVLAENLTPKEQGATTATGSIAPKAKAAPSAPPPQIAAPATETTPATETPPALPEQAPAKEAPQNTEPASSNIEHNPMAMFGSKPATDTPAPTTPPAATPAAETTETSPPENTSPPQDTPPPPEAPATEEQPTDDKPVGGSPMSFFKTSDDKN